MERAHVRANADDRTGERADERGPRDSERRERAHKGSWCRQIGPTGPRKRGGISRRGATLTGGACLPADAGTRLGRVSWVGLGRKAEGEGISVCFPFLCILLNFESFSFYFSQFKYQFKLKLIQACATIQRIS
jgi:hypothetical protein